MVYTITVGNNGECVIEYHTAAAVCTYFTFVNIVRSKQLNIHLWEWLLVDVVEG